MMLRTSVPDTLHSSLDALCQTGTVWTPFYKPHRHTLSSLFADDGMRSVYYVMQDDLLIGFLVAEATCSTMQVCDLSISYFCTLSCATADASVILKAFETEMKETNEAIYVELSALFENAVTFWKEQGYAQIADLAHVEGDIIITYGKLLEDL